MAVAYAVLHHLVENTKCKTLFITHYPLIAIELERKFPSDLQNLHMGYTAETRIDGTREITFLYQLIPGAATESFGIECARLAGVPDSVLEIATKRSAEMSDRVQRSGRKKRRVSWIFLVHVLSSCIGQKKICACSANVLKDPVSQLKASIGHKIQNPGGGSSQGYV